MKIEPCSSSNEHVCSNGVFMLHHSPLDKPFPNGETEHNVGECERCLPYAESDAE